ncbi:MAG: hypothetical protein V4760_06380, partial [Bdellovibrionota bacterium]
QSGKGVENLVGGKGGGGGFHAQKQPGPAARSNDGVQHCATPWRVAFIAFRRFFGSGMDTAESRDDEDAATDEQRRNR